MTLPNRFGNFSPDGNRALAATVFTSTIAIFRTSPAGRIRNDGNGCGFSFTFSLHGKLGALHPYCFKCNSLSTV